MSIQQLNKDNTANPFHIYYNLDLVNNETTGNNTPQIFSMTETRNSPFLMYPENYFMSVIRFQLMTPSLPVFIPAILLGQLDVNKTTYSITMTFGGFEFRQYIDYVPSDLTQPTPTPPLQAQDLQSKYYYIFSYQQWTRMFNKALQDCFNGLLAQTPLPTANAPFVEFDINNQVCIINADELAYNTSLPGQINIYFNTALATLYNNFPLQKLGFGNLTNGKNFLLEVLNINNTNVLVLPTYNALQTYQEGTTTGIMNPIQNITFTTGLFPIYSENVSLPKIFNSTTNFSNNGTNNNISPIITDFVVPWSAVNQYRQTVEYTPSGEYRLVDMFGSSPLDTIQIQVYWKDIYGNLHPFEVESGCSSSIKLMFRRKDFNTTHL
jgi:hypothetical protein